jgi:hypothetical protein
MWQTFVITKYVIKPHPTIMMFMHPTCPKGAFPCPNRGQKFVSAVIETGTEDLSVVCSGYHGSFAGVKRPGREVGHSLPSTAELQNE